MAHKTKLTKPGEWAKHLRPEGKRTFNKKERLNTKKDIDSQIKNP
jgi:hypothetical protein